MDNWKRLTEATIDGIQVDSTKKEVLINITCMWGSIKRKQIIAKGVQDFTVNEMRLSNIIDRVTRLYADPPQEYETARRVFLMIRGHEPSISDLEWPTLLDYLEKIRQGTLTFIEIEPVYGATITLLAESIQLESAEK
ncbi:hypothetical protein GCM10009091_53790 [Pseudomonas brenneri]|uniref:Uncharacterized protein n=1 Tax=Pseudomonas brenneri TaxID=129817 RepID=A0A5B2UI47_9PSED|nr:hypothetical protein [Pseudomonas brenneri]KAA2226168.1 hypothetical protein F1720_27670 [Pseudomonas brenneri]TWR71608.1 hypothetical protein FJD34_27850 [Pseudomonas brenneri]GGL65014.1 hypothetical protein GCM10009091_53790 [Pseudomonas brenneri]SDV08999.1 hypothetical protein SAMN04490181_4578 [Pseudomonas brenneri]